MASSVFTKIVNGQLESYKLLEEKGYLSFLDISPLTLGHTLVIPKKQVDYIFDLNNDEYLKLWNFTRKVSIILKRAISCDRIGISVIGFEVPHVHIHLIPINSISDMNFNNDRMKLSHQDFIDTSNKIKSFI